ncbi:MAG: shikimate dehydrogenase [Nitrososphaerales archaeon]
MKISCSTRLYGLLGYPLKHTASPSMHNAAFEALGLDAVYLVFEVESNMLEDAVRGFRALGVRGFNVTIPYKERIIPLLNRLASSAEEVGAVNTVHIVEGLLIGYNTDLEGFITPLKELNLKLQELRAVIIGAGGAAKACIRALINEKCRAITLVNRSKERALNLAQQYKYPNLKVIALSENNLKEALNQADLVVNATPVGMYPNVDESIIPKHLLRSDMIVYDLVYRPVHTQLIKDAIDVGATTILGYKMLLEQAAQSFRIWTGFEPPRKIMLEALKRELGVV